MFAIGAILEVGRRGYRHVAVFLGHDQVLQNSPDNGEEIVSVAEFARGSDIAVTYIPDIQIPVFLRRVSEIMTQPQPYHLIFNNCEHTVYRALYGRAISPQLGGLAIVISAIGLAVWAFRRR